MGVRSLKSVWCCVIVLLASQFALTGRGFAKPPLPHQQPRSSAVLSVLFIGNSHTLMPGFTTRVVSALAARAGRRARIQTRTIAKIGTTLTRQRRVAATRAAMQSRIWSAIVLQESTTAFMTKGNRSTFLKTLRWYNNHTPAGSKLILWEPWPQGPRHGLYRRVRPWRNWFPNPPKNPEVFIRLINQTVRRAADVFPKIRIAPVGSCWMALPRRKRPYAGDDYHASVRGQRFIARILARTILGNGGCP